MAPKLKLTIKEDRLRGDKVRAKKHIGARLGKPFLEYKYVGFQSYTERGSEF